LALSTDPRGDGVETTTYLGFTIEVYADGLVVLDRDGSPTPLLISMASARKRISAMRRKEREQAT